MPDLFSKFKMFSVEGTAKIVGGLLVLALASEVQNEQSTWRSDWTVCGVEISVGRFMPTLSK